MYAVKNISVFMYESGTLNLIYIYYVKLKYIEREFFDPNFTSGRKNVRILTFHNIFKICELLFVDYKIYDVSKFQVLLMKITEERAF